LPTLEQLQRLADAGIQLVPVLELTTHFVFERGGFAALVERTPEGFGGIGASGRLTETGLAPLVWRDSGPCFVAKDRQTPASEEEVAALRRFAGDLTAALRP
jgi:hypothetical protein